MKKLFIFALLLAVAYFAAVETGMLPAQSGTGNQQSYGSDHAVITAFENRQSDIQLKGSGEVIRVLDDDNDGSRHQRFILRLASGHSLLIAHNIDLAKRVSPIQTGDHVEFYGEYEWNPQGGVIHWTHHDPQRRHVAGWLKHHGRTYQ